MAEYKEYDLQIETQDENGNVEKYYPFTRLENVQGLPELREDVIANQDATNKEKSALLLLAANSYIIDDEDGKTYRLCSKSGHVYLEESDVSVKDIIDTIVTAVETAAEESN